MSSKDMCPYVPVTIFHINPVIFSIQMITTKAHDHSKHKYGIIYKNFTNLFITEFSILNE